MGNSLRCFLACVLPCGALDLIRVVHINGHVEEYSRAVSAGEVLRANPNHVLSRPCSQGGVVRRIFIVSPDSDLKRGNIYFLIPESSLPEKKRRKTGARKAAATKKKSDDDCPKREEEAVRVEDVSGLVPEALSEKKSAHRRRRSGRVGVWRPHLQSISEDQ